ncbi:MAG: DUF4349 domain-containing protein [Archangiaceae bacterium]|nr:DUF4349 domain-containing protein [Archangiaceae bacterium]
MRVGRVILVVVLVLLSCGREAEAPAAGQTERRIVHTAALSGEVASLKEVEPQVRSVAEAMGGFVSDSTATNDELTVTVRVPDAKLTEAMERLAALSTHVSSKRVSGDDVTTEFVDLTSQQKNLTAARERLVALLARAANATEALEVNRALTEVQGQLEQVQGRLAVMDSKLKLATVVVTFVPRVSMGEWRPLEVASNSVAALGLLLKAIANLAIVVLVFSPLWAPVVLLIRRRSRLV